MTVMVPHTLYGWKGPYNYQWLVIHHNLYGMQEPCNCQWLLWSPKAYMECRNLVTVYDCFGPHTLYGMQKSCICQWLMVPIYYVDGRDHININDLWSPITYMECGNLITFNDLWSPIPYMNGRDLISINDLWSPISYMECRNLVTVNDCFGPHTLYGMQEPSNCQWLFWSTYLIWNAGVLYLSMTYGPHILCGW